MNALVLTVLTASFFTFSIALPSTAAQIADEETWQRTPYSKTNLNNKQKREFEDGLVAYFKVYRPALKALLEEVKTLALPPVDPEAELYDLQFVTGEDQFANEDFLEQLIQKHSTDDQIKSSFIEYRNVQTINEIEEEVENIETIVELIAEKHELQDTGRTPVQEPLDEWVDVTGECTEDYYSMCLILPRLIRGDGCTLGFSIDEGKPVVYESCD